MSPETSPKISEDPSFQELLKSARVFLAGERLSEAADRLSEARKRAAGAPDLAQVVDTLGALQARRNELPSALNCHLFAAALAREDRSDWDGEITATSPIPEASAPSKNPLTEASSLANAGALAQVADAPAIAERALTRAAALTTASTGDHAPSTLASEIAHNFGVFLMNIGRPLDAAPHLRRAVVLDAALDEPKAVLGDLIRLAGALRRTGQPELRDEATEALERALGLAENPLRSPVAQAETLLEWGSLRFSSGDFLQAMEKTRAAVDILEGLRIETADSALQLGRAYVDLAIYARRLERPAAAMESLSRAEDQARIAKSPTLAAVIAQERARWTQE